jgi:uncharacterized membrane protein
MSTALRTTTIVTALACGLAAGVFYAFSSFVGPALDRLPDRQSVAAMNSVNKLAVKAPFMIVFIGAALLCAGLGIWALTHLGRPGAGWVLAGCALYLAGAFIVTAAANVPLNDALEAKGRWGDFYGPWMAWNHLRTAASLAAAAALTLAAL